MRTAGREYRIFADMTFTPDKGENTPAYEVRGRAIVFDTPTLLAEFDGVKYYEIIDRNALAACDMSDVIFNYNHGGKVVARLRNNTLKLNISGEGLDIIADLSGTEEGRRLYEEIRGGYIDKMSFAFVVDENGGEEYDAETHTRKVLKIRKLYDVSAVDIPAYNETTLSARNSFSEEHEKEFKLLEEERQRRRRLIALTKI